MRKPRLQTTAELLDSKPLLFDSVNDPIRYDALTSIGVNVHESIDPYYQNFRRPVHYNNYAKDFKDLVSGYGRMKLCSMARNIYHNLGVIHSAINSISTEVVGHGYWWKYTGKNQEWGKNAVNRMERISTMMDVRGCSRNFQQMLWITNTEKMICGDILWVFTTSKDGMTPQFQTIPGHRIGNHDNQIEVKSGQYKGYKVIDGCIMNDWDFVLGYQILGDKAGEDFTVPREACFLVFEPVDATQFRGVSAMSAAMSDIRDYKDIRDFYKQTVKNDSHQNTVINKESPIGSDFGSRLSGASINADNQVVPAIYGNTNTDAPFVRIFRAGSGEKMELLTPQRPSLQVMEFQQHLLRSILESLGWMYELYDRDKLGGASARFVLGQAQRMIAYRHQNLLYNLFKWVTKKSIAHLMATNQIPYVDDWYMIEPTPTRKMVLDYFKDAKTSIEEVKFGHKSSQMVADEEGNDWATIIEEKGKAYQKLLEISKETGAPVEWLMQTTPNLQTFTTPKKEDDEH